MTGQRAAFLKDLGRHFGLAVCYAVIAKGALAFLSSNHMVSIVWPPSGIAVAALLVWGRGYWPGILLGAFFGNVAAGSSVGVSLGIGIGNTCEALTCHYLLGRVFDFNAEFKRPKDYFALIGAGALSVGVAVCIGVSTLVVSGNLEKGLILGNVLHWFEGDFFGILLVVPLVTVWHIWPPEWLKRERALEAVSCFGLAMVVGQLMFFEIRGDPISRGLADAAIFLTVSWAALRFGRHGATLSLCIVALLGLLGIVHSGSGAATGFPEESLVRFWIYMTPLTFVGVMTALTIHERKQAQFELRALTGQLEEHVAARTKDLAASERRFRTLVENAPEAIILFDMVTGRFVEINKNAASLLGYSEEEFLRLSPDDICPEFQPDGRKSKEAVAHYFELVARGESAAFTWNHLHSSGAEIPCEVRLVRLPSTNGFMIRASLIDISDRLRSESQLRTAISVLESTLESTADGILVVDAKGQITHYNRRFSELWRLPEERLSSRDDAATLKSILDQLQDAPAFLAKVQDLYSQPEAESFDIILFKDGRVFERYSRPQRLGDEIVGRVWSFRDATERIRTERAHRQIESKLHESQKLEAIGTLAGGIAHDFNNILNAITGNVELARGDPATPAQVQDALNQIQTASLRAADLVRQMLTFSQPQSERRALVYLEPILRDAAKFVRATLPSMIEVTVLAGGKAAPVHADTTQIHRVLVNLCTNAWHAIGDRPGSVELRQDLIAIDGIAAATLSPDLHPGLYVRLSVRDNGSGMDKATRSRIFEPFFTTKEAGKGTGLGLSVAFGIVRAHGGALTVDTEVGKGSTFFVYLPAQEGAAAEPAKAEAAIESVPGRGERVLFVDDEAAIARVCSRLLERSGYRVTAFTSPVDALASVRAAPADFDVVVTDLTMPIMSGMEFAAQVGSLRANLPVILATGNTGLLTQEKIREIGVREVLRKPMTASSLGDAVARVLGRQ